MLTVKKSFWVRYVHINESDIMKIIFNFLKTFFLEIPSNLQIANRPTYLLQLYGTIAALVFHFLWMIFFLIMHVNVLFISNLISSLYWFSAVYLVRKRAMLKTVSVLSAIELLISQTISIYVLGWGYGFQLYYLIIPLFVFLIINPRIVISAVILLITMVCYVVTYNHTGFNYTPLIMLSVGIEKIFLSINAVSTILFIGTFAFIYSRDAYDSYCVEEKEKNIALNNMKKNIRLISIVTHDIANALSVCKLSVNVLKKERAMLPKEVKYLSRLDCGLIDIMEIVNSVSMMKSIDDGKAALILGSVDIRDVLEKTMSLFLEKLNEKRLTLELSYENDRPLFAIAEPVMLKNSIINNLVSNAIKFSHLGACIKVSASKKKSQVIISISDSGIGIPEDLIRKIFSFTEKTNRPGTDGEPGTGYGLPVVKSVVELFKGTIDVESISETKDSENHGTTFTLTLPAA
jgi:signal transduction histidine kinase